MHALHLETRFSVFSAESTALTRSSVSAPGCHSYCPKGIIPSWAAAASQMLLSLGTPIAVSLVLLILLGLVSCSFAFVVEVKRAVQCFSSFEP